MRQEIDQDIELDKTDDTNGNENLYRELIVTMHVRWKLPFLIMEQQSILSNVINYVQYNKHPKKVHSMSVRPVNKMKSRIKRRKDDKDLYQKWNFGCIT